MRPIGDYFVAPMSESIDYAAFREQIHAFASTHCPADIKAIVAENRKLTREPWSRWQRILFERGWGAPNWPTEYGGTGWNPRQRAIFDAVMAECDCPPQYHHGLRHIGPVLIEFGTPDQKLRYLPRILDGSDWWCQGYSEPGAGSDLAALKTRAEQRGDVYIVNGQKIWTSHAHEADLMYTLVRTSNAGKKQEGITLLLIPLRSKGLVVRPIRTIDGWHHVNEVFLNDVEVPIRNRVGDEGSGWSYGKFLLQRERLSSANTSPLAQFMERTRRLIAVELTGEGNRRRRETLEMRLLRIEAEIAGQRELGLRAIDDVMNRRPLGLTTSVLKLASSRIFQQISEISLEVVGPRLTSRFPVSEGAEASDEIHGITWLQNYLFLRSRTIVGGTNEVQKNVVARELFEH
jgi:alkylation response protein AidB-like acyl-CoA dehydrogenase